MTSLTLSPVFHKNVEAYKGDKRYIINQGGSSSSKTYSILQMLTFLAMNNKLQIDVCGLTVPHLKAGVLNDMPHVSEGFGLDFHSNFNKSEKEIAFASGGLLRFIALDNIGKAHGGRRDVLYINEANYLAYPIAEQLMMRTRRKVIIDYNPSAEFWVHKTLMKEEGDKCQLIKSTYRDNPLLEQAIIDKLLARAEHDENFRRVYVEGDLGVTEGLVFNNFEQRAFNKDSFEKYYYGVDWGFSEDPFAFVECAIENNTLYICREIYQKGLLNRESAPLVKEVAGKSAVICDSAEPKSVAEFRSLGVNARSAKKGKGSIEQGVKNIQSFDKVVIHTDCPHTYEEFMNYAWKVDKNGEPMPMPVDNFNHILDSLRYALEETLNKSHTRLVGERPF